MKPSTSHSPTSVQDENVQMPHRYNLITALAMIIGICVGSGIFFKSDNILIATNGNIILGVIMMVIAATAIIFGGLSLAVYAERCEGSGGIYSYARAYLSPAAATYIGWHYSFLYLPIMAAVVSWVVGIYTCILFGLSNTLEMQVGIGCIFLFACTSWNIFAPVLAGHFQSLTTVLKMIPLLFVAIVGIFFTPSTAPILVEHSQQISNAGMGWLMAAGPIAFAFDGWNTGLSITPELKNPKRNVPLSLVIGPLIILALYLAYFVGISCYLGPQTVMEAGDASLSLLFTQIFGEKAAVLPNIIALIAIAGTANGIILATLRMPLSLALHHEIPFEDKISHINEKLNFPVVSACVASGTAFVWMFIHYVIQHFNLLPNGDLSEIGVIATCFVMPVLYVRLFGLWKNHEVGLFRGLITPAIATIVSVSVGLSGMSDPSRWPLMLIYPFFVLLAIVVTKKKERQNKVA